MTRHSCLPTLLITEKGSDFVLFVIHDLDNVLSITLGHAIMKHAQTIGVSEGTLATTKASLKMSSGDFRKQWLKNFGLAVINYNTTYHTSIGCEPSQKVHGPVANNILDQILGLKFKAGLVTTTEFAEARLRRTQILYDKTKKNVMQSYFRCKNISTKKQHSNHCKTKTAATYYNLNRITKDQKYHS